MNFKTKWLIAGFALLLAVVATILATRNSSSAPGSGGFLGIFGKTSPEKKMGKPVIPVSVQMNDICTQLSATKDPATARQLLSQLRDLLNSLPHDVASREIQNFLITGKDASTHLDLKVGTGGIISDASSMRVFLLNYLGLVDPTAAGAVAMQILAHYTTPDEWALSLRNYAWAHPNSTDPSYLLQKSAQLLANAAWSKDPSVGYLEAFDTIVYTHDTAVTPQLSSFVRDKDNPATAHAAFLTMDRLVIAEPKTMLKTLVDQSDLMKGREQTRADFMARADLGQSDQRELVEKYLLDPNRSPQELSQFMAIYPNFNYMISDNLLTQNPTATRDDIVQRDQSALAVVKQWEEDSRFEQLKPDLTKLEQRLDYFVQQAGETSH